MNDKLKILIIEDIASEAEILVHELKRGGLHFEKIIVENEEEYGDALNEFKPDIILSDYNLPQFNGMQALIIKNKIAPQVPFILVTGSINEEIAVECMKAGADDYIIKGNFSRLMAAINEALKKKEVIKSKMKIEEALLESEKIFSSFMEYCPVYFFFKDDEARPVRLSKNYEELLGLPVSEAIGKSMYELFPHDLAKTMIDDDTKVMRENIPVRVVEAFGGRIFETIKFPIRMHNDISYLAGFTIDVTDRVKAEEALRVSEQRFQQIAEITGEWIWEVNADGLYTYISKMGETILGYTADEIIGKKHFYDFFVPGKKIEMKELALAVFRAKESFMGFENENLHKDGHVVILETTGIPLIDENNNLIGYRGVDTDITNRKKANQELIAAKEKAEESDRLKTAFLHNISHEIRTPMNAIVGFSTLLEDPDLASENIRNFSEIICQSSDQLLSIISDIVNIATVEAGQEKLNLKEVRLNKVLSIIHEQFRLKAGESNLSLNFHPGLPDEKASFESDETKLIQILSNLLNNAFKFTEKGRIDFGYELKKGNLEFYVKDTGIGIQENVQKKVFERFFQVESSLSRKAGGTGLGLSLSKAYVELMGGEIWVKSSPGEGCTFFFTIPHKRINFDDKHEKGTSKTMQMDVGKKKSILIAEDEDTNFMLLKYILGRHNLHLVRAKDGVEAVELFRKGIHFDLVIMDIKMPRMDGIEATRFIREMNPDIPVIALTAYAQESDKQKILSSGFNAYISKPFEKAGLFAVLEKYLFGMQL